MTAHVLTVAGIITASTAGLAALGWVLKLLGKMGRLIADMHDDWRGEPDRPGVTGRRGVMERLSAIEKELTYNGGKSTKDMLTALARKVDEVARLQSQYHPVSPVQINMNPGQPPTIEVGAEGGH